MVTNKFTGTLIAIFGYQAAQAVSCPGRGQHIGEHIRVRHIDDRLGDF